MIRTELAEEVSGDLEEKFSSMKTKKIKLRSQLNYWFQVFGDVDPVYETVSIDASRELKITGALGASISNLWQLLSTAFVILVIIACLIAIPLSFSFMQHWLLQYDYHTTISWQLFVVTAFGAFSITLITVSFQALKTAFSYPVDSLKSE